jgi:hypothetical protein
MERLAHAKEKDMTQLTPVIVKGTLTPMLKSLDAILEKAAAFADEKGLDLVNARLAPDMFTLAQQVQIACYFARETPSRLTGQQAALDIGEAATSIDGMREQVAEALAIVATLEPVAFEGAESRHYTIEPRNADFMFDMPFEPFLLRWSLPNFYFHLVIAYAILRKEGLDIGKLDFLGSFDDFKRPKA